jgi:hypothetical protein
MLNIPSYISILFALTTVATVLLFYSAIRRSAIGQPVKTAKGFGIAAFIWLSIQGVLSLKNFYNSDPSFMPPKIVLTGVLPMMVLIVFLFISGKGRIFIDNLPLKNITWINVIRIPVEIVLLFLFLNNAVPQLMTFEGKNFDIISGITAPFIAYYGFTNKLLGRRTILAWNIVCLALLMNIVIRALLSTPSPLQKLAFDHPNIAILHFPFSWLPSFIVPVILFGHLASIRQLTRKGKVKSNDI